jgi:hypothetical protein
MAKTPKKRPPAPVKPKPPRAGSAPACAPDQEDGTGHKTLRMSLALKAKVTDHMWTFEELVDLIDRDQV